MNKLTCEICKSNELLKENDFFICQKCGCKYTLKEVQKLIEKDNYEKDPFGFETKTNNRNEYFKENSRASATSGESNSVEKGSPFVKFCIILIPIAFIIAIIVIISNANSSGNKNKDGNPMLLTRSANNNDINLTVNNDFSLSINSVLTPNVDISNLQITFVFLDSNNARVTTKIKTVGNVSKNNNYTVTFSLSEFTFTELLVINQYSASVTGGTVSYFSS